MFRNKTLVLVSSVCLFAFANLFMLIDKGSNPNYQYNLTINPIDRMPLIENDPFAALAYGGIPNEQRSVEFRKWLSNGLKIKVSGASGSGTIVYFNDDDGWAYVQSCGHLWSGNMNANEGQRRKQTCTVQTWYHNDIKLNQPKDYVAEILYYSNSRGRDVSLIRFRPDWQPNYLPIAPEDFQYTRNMRLHSVGCDGGDEQT